MQADTYAELRSFRIRYTNERGFVRAVLLVCILIKFTYLLPHVTYKP